MNRTSGACIVAVASSVFLITAVAAYTGGAFEPERGNGVHLSSASADEDELAEELQDQQNIMITPLPPKRDPKGMPGQLQSGDMISANAAVLAAQAQAAFLSDVAPSSVQLVSFTDGSYGPEVTPNGSNEGVVQDPILQNLPAYAVVFSGVDIPAVGTQNSATQSEGGVAFVDAYTGQVYEFVTIELT